MQMRPYLRLLYTILLCATGVIISSISPAQTLNRSGEDENIFVSHTIFLPKHSFPSGDQNWNVKTADMNLDGFPDIITVSKIDGMVNVHLNDSKGSFEEKVSTFSRKHNRALCVLHANEDEFEDIATVSVDGILSILHNDGQGELRLAEQYDMGVMAHDVHASDLDGDGRDELIAAIVSSRKVKIYARRNGDNFVPTHTLETGWEPRAVISGDLNGDKLEDLVVGCDDNKIYLYFNQGGGTFSDKTPVFSGAANWALGIADFNKDGHLDIATASYMDKMLSIHLNDGSANFDKSQEILSGDHNFDLVCGDFDQDNDIDIVTCSTVDEAISFHLNDGAGVFGSRIGVPSGDWNAGIAKADFDSDGDLDIVSASINDRMINVHRNITLEAEIPEIVEEPVSRLAYFCIRGTVRDAKTLEIIPLAEIKALNPTGIKLSEVKSRTDGTYEICLKPTQYKLATRFKGYFHDLTAVSFLQNDSSEVIEQDIYLNPLEKEAKVVLKNIYFDVDKSTLRNESFIELEQLLELLQENPSLIVQISGHTDSDGTDAHNESLSQGRAQAVVDFLTEAGIEVFRMGAKGYGESQPVAENDSKENKQLNRRTEFKVVDY